MRHITYLIAGLWCLSTSAIPQQAPTQARKFVSVATLTSFLPVRVAALNISREGGYPSTVKMAGNVEVTTPVCLRTENDGKLICDGYMVLRADEATLREDTGQIEAQGHVSVIPLQHESAKQ